MCNRLMMFAAAAPIVIGVLPLPQTPSGIGIDPPGTAIGAAGAPGPLQPAPTCRKAPVASRVGRSKRTLFQIVFS